MALEPGGVAQKLNGRAIGLVAENTVKGGRERAVPVSVRRPR
jgi:hypothetical protein